MTQVSRKGFVDKNGKKVVLKDPTKADKVENATAGNLASLDENGNLQDSRKKPTDFAPANHVHKLIKCEGTGDNALDSAAVVVGVNTIDIEIEKSGVLYNAEINTTNFANLLRALQDPAAPASGGNKLITNGQVYEALLNAGSIAQVNLKSTVVKDNSSYTYFGVKYGSSTEEENWPEGDPEGMYGQLRLALGETENTVIPFELTVKNGSDVVQAVVLGFVYYTKTSYTVEGNTSYNHNYKFCIGSFVYSLDISEYHGHFDFPTTAFVGNNSVNSL